MGHAVRIVLDVAVVLAAFGLLMVAGFLAWAGHQIARSWCRAADRPAHPGRPRVRERVAPIRPPAGRRFRCDCRAGGHDDADSWIDCQAARRTRRAEGVAS